jgi:uncharacterized protein
VLALVLTSTLLAAPPAARPSCTVPDGTRVRLELALTEEEQQLGLMFRDTLAPDAGMLFVFKTDGTYPFWMKNTFIPLDMIWMDSSGRVVDVHDHVLPCHSDPCPSAIPRAPGRAVLEVNAGFAAAHGVRPGALLRFAGVPEFPVGRTK